MSNKKVAVFGIFEDRSSVESAVEALKNKGFSNNDISVLMPDSKEKGALGAAKEAIVGAAMQVFKHQRKDQFATEIPLSGTLENSDTDAWTIIKNILRNAFVKAFVPKYSDTAEKQSMTFQKK